MEKENATIDGLVQLLKRIDSGADQQTIQRTEKLAEVLLITKNMGYNWPNIRRVIAAGFRITPGEGIVPGHIHTTKHIIVYGSSF